MVNSWVKTLNDLAQRIESAIEANNGRTGQQEEVKRTQETLQGKLDLLRKLIPMAAKETLTEQDVIDAESITCYGLAYCCGIKREDRKRGKDCPWRDSARAALHISDDLYVQKEVVLWQLLAATERSSEWIEEKATHLPQ